jgi:hypothetical protein
MSKLPTPAKFALLAAAIALALVAGWFAVIAPKRSEAAKLQSQIDDAQALIDSAHAGQSPSQPQVPAVRVADLFELSRAMPNRADIPGVLLQLSKVADETGVTFESITPHDPVQFDPYQQIDIDLVFQGRFYDLSDFLFRLRNLVRVNEGALDATGRLFSVGSIAFGEGELTFPEVKATLTVSAYVFGDGTAATTPSAAASAGQSTTPTTTSATDDSQPIPAAPSGATAAGA